MVLELGLDIAKLLRMLSPPHSALNYPGSPAAFVPREDAVVIRAAKAADLLSQSCCPAALLLCGGGCHLPLLAPMGPRFKISWGSIATENGDGEGRMRLGQREGGGLLVGSCHEAA